jgi:endonuclease/exonuclease/phosphatase (EEP) superfamily protein YafD
LLVAGDFNDSEHSRVVNWLKHKGMINALPQFDRSTATWEWHYGVVNLHRRMDHILYPSELQCRSAQVLRDGASDHFPVQAVFSR